MPWGLSSAHTHTGEKEVVGSEGGGEAEGFCPPLTMRHFHATHLEDH